MINLKDIGYGLGRVRIILSRLVRLATNLYDVKTEKLRWSEQSESLDPGSINQIIDTDGLDPKIKKGA